MTVIFYIFSAARISSTNTEGGAVYGLSFSQPPGGLSLSGSSHVGHFCE